jgi:hypothetical protein
MEVAGNIPRELSSFGVLMLGRRTGGISTPIDDAGGQVGKGTSIGCLKNPMFHLDVAETGDYLNPWFGSNSGQL